MVKYSCERCLKEFSQKSHYDSHNRRKYLVKIMLIKLRYL